MLYSPGPLTRQRSGKLLDNYVQMKEEDRNDISISPLTRSVSPLLRQDSLFRGNTLGRQQSILLDQDNVVLNGKRNGNNLDTSTLLRDSKQQQTNPTLGKAEDFNMDFMNMLS